MLSEGEVLNAVSGFNSITTGLLGLIKFNMSAQTLPEVGLTQFQPDVFIHHGDTIIYFSGAQTNLGDKEFSYLQVNFDV